MNIVACLWPDCDRTDIYARGLCRRCRKRASDQGILELFAAPERQCGTCGQIFRTGKNGKHKYCSESCQKEGVRIRAKARREATLRRQCEGCSNEIGPELRADARFCSPECRARSWYQQNEDLTKSRAREWGVENRDRAKDWGHRRRAAMRGSATGPIDYQAVWDRDAGCCWICSLPVDATLSYPDPGYRSWDHVIPISAGGTHTMDNIALSHLRCNLEKKAQILDRKPAWAS